MAKHNKKVKADTAIKNHAILGVYEGECADATITNKNGMDITRPVWENVFASEDYAQAIELGWYIGFLGHPDDPNCMDFEHACIVMTEGSIDSRGKVTGKFNLIDTPVGRIVKAFQDAGVTFGISVRGAGDIVGNSVDPDTFVFRGFDLVTFPAFPESIPTFSEIAASTDMVKRAKYQSVCSAVTSNLSSITSCEALDIIQAQFAAQSEEYKAIEARKAELNDGDEVQDINDAETDLADAKVEGMTRLYLEQLSANTQLIQSNETLKREVATNNFHNKRKLTSIERITACQIADLQKTNRQLTIKCSKLSTECKQHISAKKSLESRVAILESSNLKYKQKIEANSKLLDSKNSTISRLRTELDETVNAASEAKSRTSNLDAKVRQLETRITAAEKLVAEYQDAYATLYATAAGLRLDNITVTASTSVSEMQSLISGTNTSNMSSVFVEPTPIEIVDVASEDADDIVTM